MKQKKIQFRQFHGLVLGLVGLIENCRNWKTQFFLSRPFWIFFSKKKKLFCFMPMKISYKLCHWIDGTQFWCFTWYAENSLLCVILRYTVYTVLSTFLFQPWYLGKLHFINHNIKLRKSFWWSKVISCILCLLAFRLLAMSFIRIFCLFL